MTATATPAPVCDPGESASLAHLFEARRLAAREGDYPLMDLINATIRAARLGNARQAENAIHKGGWDS